LRRTRQRNGLAIASSAALLALVATGCSVQSLAVNALADSLAASGDVFASDEDPELVRDALPFALKTMESLLAEKPDHPGLLLSTCKGFTQYSFAFVETDAEVLEDDDYEAALAAYDRALKLYLRARDYCLRALELREEGIRRRLEVEPESALAGLGVEDVELLFWTGAAWGSAVSVGKDRPEITVDIDAVRALVRRALELDESFEQGSVHEVMMVLESLPPAMGGSPDRAREHFDRAVELSRGQRASTFVSLAENVAVPAQDRAEFERLLERALAIDPDEAPSGRLANIIAQRRAVRLQAKVDDLFLE
jgi:predicted anti-sigma-YlaC factor YlaD